MIEWNRARLIRYYRAGLTALLLLALMAQVWISGVSDFLCGSLVAFTTLSQYTLENFIRSYGAQVAVMSFFLMILQTIVTPLPAFVITFANASLSGTSWGGALSWNNAMTGATLCLFIVRVLGRDTVEKPTEKTVLNNMDAFAECYGKHTTLVCRLLPFVPFDPVSYVTGLTSTRFRYFFITTGIGRLPAAIIYSWAGSLLTGGTFWFVTSLFVLFALGMVVSVARGLYLKRQRKKN